MASLNAARAPMNRADAEDALHRLRAEADAISAALLGLEDHPGRRFLESAATAGVTLERWTAAQAAIGLLWEWFGRSRDVLRRAGDTRDLSELTELLQGQAAELVAAMTAGYRDVVDVLEVAERIWSDYVPWLDRMDERLRAATASELGGPELSRVGDEVSALRAVVFSDPLSLPENDGRIARLTADLDRARQEIDELLRLRRERDVDIAGLRGALSRLAEAERQARDMIDVAGTKISAAPADAPEAVAVLTARLDKTSSIVDLRRLATALPQLRATIEGAIERANQARDTARGLLDRRAELRGRLEAYHVKAARTNRSEDEELTVLHQRAHDLLWRAPCDLAAATTAVLAYQRALGGKGVAR